MTTEKAKAMAYDDLKIWFGIQAMDAANLLIQNNGVPTAELKGALQVLTGFRKAFEHYDDQIEKLTGASSASR